MRKEHRGFSLVELMIVIVVVAVLSAGALQYYVNSIEDAKTAKAKLDCDTIARAIVKYEAIENAEIESLADLKSTHIANIDALKDPWGKPYLLDRSRGSVLSRGPDGKHLFGNPKSELNRDDIEILYSPGLMLADADIVGGLDNPENANHMNMRVLRLTFTKRVKVVRDIDFTQDIAAGPHFRTPAHKGGENRADPACPQYAFRWFLDRPDNALDGNGELFPFNMHNPDWLRDNPPCPPAYLTDYTWTGQVHKHEWEATCKAHGLDPKENHGFGIIYRSAAPKEVFLALPHVAASALMTGRYFINLTGTRRNADDGRGNPVFQAFDGTLGAQMSPAPIRVR